jgi:hypothetical protein
MVRTTTTTKNERTTIQDGYNTFELFGSLWLNVACRVHIGVFVILEYS